MGGGAGWDWINGADRLIRLKQGHEREGKGVLHARTPEGVELALEDAQRVTDRLIAVPAETHVEQIYSEGTLAVGDVQVDAVSATFGRHKRQRRRCEIAVWVDQDKASLIGPGLTSAGFRRPSQHEVVYQAEHQGRFATPGLGYREQMAPEQTRR